MVTPLVGAMAVADTRTHTDRSDCYTPSQRFVRAGVIKDPYSHTKQCCVLSVLFAYINVHDVNSGLQHDS